MSRRLAGVTEFVFSKSAVGGISNWSWDFGDGETSTEVSPTHVYQSPGSYNVGLTVSGDWGSATKAYDGLFSADNSAPGIELAIADVTGDEDVSIIFDLSAHEVGAQRGPHN
jgi:PKD repeat protein